VPDPKYPVRNGVLCHIDGYEVPAEEPVMVFRGKDIGSLDAICEYIEMLEDQPKNNTIYSHLISSIERLNAFYFYQKQNPHLNSVGCSQRSHEGITRFFQRAEEILLRHSDELAALSHIKNCKQPREEEF